MQAYTESSLLDAINELVNELVGNLRLDIEVNPETEELSANVKDEIYLIVREAVTNIKLHAQAKRAMVTIETSPSKIHLFIQDDGQGFSLKDITKKSEGLMRMWDCARRLGAGVEMDTSDLNDGGASCGFIYRYPL